MDAIKVTEEEMLDSRLEAQIADRLEKGPPPLEYQARPKITGYREHIVYAPCPEIGCRYFGITWLPNYPGVWSIRFFRGSGHRFAQFGRVRFWVFWPYE